jgi:mono/diheme cytochrome c family protein
LRGDRSWEGWRGVSLVAITYVYFLIFAQFGFLKYLAAIGLEGNYLKAAMGVMAAGGILASLLAPQFVAVRPSQRRLQTALAGCALAAGLTLLRLNLFASLTVAFLIGSSLGLLTVTLVTHLRRWIGGSHPLFQVGLGTGIGYLLCNDPQLFAASPRVQAGVSVALCMLGIGIADRTLAETPGEVPAVSQTPAPSFLLVLACFTALVWLDSAAFFIIQNTPALKAGTWEGTIHLWVNGGLHLIAAMGGVWLLRRVGLAATLACAFGFLACACLLLSDPARVTLASAFYPLGVSLYSVALVAYPSFLAPPATVAQRGLKAGLIYAIAGWVGSALGIGMGQNLGHIPAAFVLAAAALFLSPTLWQYCKQRRRESLVTAALLVLAFGLQKATSMYSGRQEASRSVVELGRQTYISEGCINCHSQYVRPTSADVIMWGPAESLDVVRHEQPPLIGNRRQGPDLAKVGDRRSALWLKAHFIDPSAVSHASFMPSYAYLFRDSRGDALVAYMESLGSAQGREDRLHMAEGWRPSPKALETAGNVDGAKLFNNYCATCHQSDGDTRSAWRRDFRRLPPLFATGPLLYVPRSADSNLRLERICEIVKFGLPGTDMPGHEYLPDDQVAAIAHWVAGFMTENQLVTEPLREQLTGNHNTPGEDK